MAGTYTEEGVKVKVKEEIKEPCLYKVIYLNDEVTTMEFVIETLMAIFNHTREAALEITEKIHTDGSAIVAVLPYEMAEQRGIEATLLARNNSFPLQIKLEPDL
jgi:ATP-dependent Clp protease adaptor protein ClpS